MPKAMVLLSGGIDSTTCLYVAMKEFGAENVLAASVDYGQRHNKELDYARSTCRSLNILHHVIDLSAVVPKTMLTDSDQAVPEVSYAELDAGVSPTYVPFRNGLMLSAIASYFFGWLKANNEDTHSGEHAIYYGAHAEDGQNWAYADCTPEFNGAMSNAIHVGCYGEIRLHTPLQWLKKADIVQLGDRLGVAWENTWSCYKGEELHCGTCPTCRARHEGFVRGGIHDPTKYAVPMSA